MANARDLLKRKKSVQNTCKITRTMELVASAKMKKAQDAAMSSRPYAEALASLVNRLSEAAGDASHELMTQRPVKNVTLLVATSDRGLCGAFNGNIIRMAIKRIEEHEKLGHKVKVVSLAKKVASTLSFFGHSVDAQHKGIMDAPSFEQAQNIIEPVIADFLRGDVDAVEVIYARFESAARINPQLTTLLPAGTDTDEAADLYVYRLAEQKAIKIGNVTRVLKEIAVDCLLNSAALNFSQDKINKVVQQKLSSGTEIDFRLGDKDGSEMCDFMNCQYSCSPTAKIPDIINDQTYNENFINMNLDKILQRIRILFSERYIYKKTELIKNIQHIKHYPLEQIYSALNFFINEKNEYITDILGRRTKVNTNKLLFYIYNDGTVEKKIIIE